MNEKNKCNTCTHIGESERKIERGRVCERERGEREREREREKTGVKEAVHVHTWRKGEF